MKVRSACGKQINTTLLKCFRVLSNVHLSSDLLQESEGIWWCTKVFCILQTALYAAKSSLILMCCTKIKLEGCVSVMYLDFKWNTTVWEVNWEKLVYNSSTLRLVQGFVENHIHGWIPLVLSYLHSLVSTPCVNATTLRVEPWLSICRCQLKTAYKHMYS